MYKFVPDFLPNKVTVFSIMAAVMTGVSLYTASVIQQYKWLFQILAVFFAASFIQLTVRYMLSKMIYILDGNKLVVVKEQGKRAEQLCKIDLSAGIAILSKNEYKSHAKEFGNVAIVRNFCRNFLPSDAEYLLFDFSGKLALAIFEPDTEMTVGINNVITDSKQKNI
ncbi:MAG: hypothetical protein VB118_10980 [Oscillospiraceae bacterium]|nr:hypothetical protein [Oscillospiraceae bacterium]